MKKLSAAVIGAILGIAGVTVLNSLNWLNLIPWAFIALIIGYLSLDKKSAIWNGTIYGYVLVIAFTLAGYGGEMTLLGWLKITIVGLILGLIGALLGGLGALVGNFLKRKPVPPS